MQLLSTSFSKRCASGDPLHQEVLSKNVLYWLGDATESFPWLDFYACSFQILRTMTQRYCLPIIACLLLVHTTQAQVEKERGGVQKIRFDVAANKQIERNKLGLAGNVRGELARLQLFTKFSDEVIEKIEVDVSPLIKKYDSLPVRIPADEILHAIAEAANGLTNNPSLLVKYQADLENRLTFDKTMAIQTDVYFIDCIVGLDDEQWDVVRAICSELYRQENHSLRTLIQSDPELVKPELQQFRKSLSQVQIEGLAKFIPKWSGEINSSALTPPFRLLAELKIRQLASVAGLNPQQRTKLEFVSKRTIVPNAVERRIKVKDDFRKYALALAGKGPLLTNEELFDTMNLSDQRIPFFFPDDRWQKFVLSTLTEKQAQTWKRFTDRRQEAAIDTHAYAVTERLSQLPLTSDQQIAAHNLIKRSVKARGAKLEDSFVEFVDDPNSLPRVITQQEFSFAIGKDNWAKLDGYSKRALPIKRNDLSGAVGEN